MSDIKENNIAPFHFDKTGRPVYTVTSRRKEEGKADVIYKMPDRIIPVIFLPGVMGSNLKNDKHQSIWKADSIASMLSWTTKSASQRKKLLDPSKTSVDSDGAIEPEGEEERQLFRSRRERGWGEVAAMSYGTFLVWLQQALNDHRIMMNNKISQNGKKTLREELLDKVLHAEIGESPLTKEEVALSYKYFFPVHAIGYNWLQSNTDSAGLVNVKIKKIINDYQADGRKCEKVILVTHSMGGLVARYYSELLAGQNGEKYILGIVHGVMPDLGAPMAYKRMKAGEAGTTGWVIGSNGAEMTAVLAQSPGPLQLLPGTGYGKGWLHIDGMAQRLPLKDPYNEIYTKRSVWWALCEERFINPDNKLMDKIQLDKDWGKYTDVINWEVKKFIEKLSSYYHKYTYAFYGNDGNTYPTYASLHWKDISSDKANKKYRSQSSGKGVIFYPPTVYNKTVRIAGLITENDGNIYRKYTLLPPADAGDGTVPVSAAAIRAPHVKALLGLSIDHEGAYKNEHAHESRWFTLRSIIKIAQQVNSTGLAYVS